MGRIGLSLQHQGTIHSPWGENPIYRRRLRRHRNPPCPGSRHTPRHCSQNSSGGIRNPVRSPSRTCLDPDHDRFLPLHKSSRRIGHTRRDGWSSIGGTRMTHSVGPLNGIRSTHRSDIRSAPRLMGLDTHDHLTGLFARCPHACHTQTASPSFLVSRFSQLFLEP